MSTRIPPLFLSALGIVIFFMSMVYPAGALVVRGFTHLQTDRSQTQTSQMSQDGTRDSATPQVVLGPARFGRRLFVTSVGLASAAAVAAVLIALPGAYVVGRLQGGSSDRRLSGALLAPLLFPPMVYAFGWQRLVSVPDAARCIWVWAIWAWPIPALLIGVGWRRVGRRLFEEALVSAGPSRAFAHAVLPALGPQVGVSLLLLLALFLGNYSVPHACGLTVYATKLLACAQDASDPAVTLLASAPIVGVIALAVVLAAWLWSRQPSVSDTTAAGGAPLSAVSRLIPLGLLAVSLVPPVIGLTRGIQLPVAILETLRTYGPELAVSIGLSLLAAALAVFMGLGVAAVSPLGAGSLACALMWAALPGALVGEAVVIAYLPFAPIYDHWPLMVLGHVARFGWIGIAVAWLARASVGSNEVAAARCDGAGATLIAWRVAFASNWPMLLWGTPVIAAFCLSEVATTALVRVPSVDPVALILIEKFHRFEDGMLAALSYLLVAAAAPGAILAGVTATWPHRS